MQRTKPAKKAHRHSAGPFASGRPEDDGQENRNRHYPREDALASTRDACAAPRNPPLILFCPPCREYAKIFHRLARRVAVVRDANLAVVRIAARNARSSREMLRHAANVPG